MPKNKRNKKEQQTLTYMTSTTTENTTAKMKNNTKNKTNTNTTTNTVTDMITAATTSTMAIDALASISTTTTKMTTPKHQGRKKHKCDKCGKTVYHLKRHLQDSCPGVGNAKVPSVLIQDEKTGRFISSQTANTKHTRSTKKYLSPETSKVTRLDDDGLLFFSGCKDMKNIFTDLVKNLEIDKKQKFGIYEKEQGGILHVTPGVFGSKSSNHVKLNKVLSLLESQSQFYLFQEFEGLDRNCVERVLRSLNLPENKFNGSLIRLDKIGFFMSNGCSYVHEHSDPGSGFLVMVGGEGCTRMFFPESKSEATLTAKGEFVHVKHGVKHRVFSKGTRLCLSIFSYSEEDIKVINKNSRK